jgi:hypothetical protein
MASALLFLASTSRSSVPGAVANGGALDEYSANESPAVEPILARGSRLIEGQQKADGPYGGDEPKTSAKPENPESFPRSSLGRIWVLVLRRWTLVVSPAFEKRPHAQSYKLVFDCCRDGVGLFHCKGSIGAQGINRSQQLFTRLFQAQISFLLGSVIQSLGSVE